MRKSEWAQSSNGPDWTDVLMTMNVLEQTHDCRVGLTVTTAGLAHNGSGKVTVFATFDVLPGSEIPARVEVAFTWPSGRGFGLVGSAYRALLELDYKVGGQYRQSKLPE